MCQKSRAEGTSAVSRRVVVGRSAEELFSEFFVRETGRELDDVERGVVESAVERVRSERGDDAL